LTRRTSRHRVERGKTCNQSRFLALFVTSLQPDATIRARGIDRAVIVGSEERAWCAARKDDGLPFRLYLGNHQVRGLAAMEWVAINQTWFAEHVKVVSFDN
jgi:hypothetical protein